MSELICPVCGSALQYFYGSPGWHACDECSFRCDEKDFPIISAAMELAMLLVREDDTLSFGYDLKEATKRVRE